MRVCLPGNFRNEAETYSAMNRLMFYYNLIQTYKKETTQKVYEKQKEQTTTGDWFESNY